MGKQINYWIGYSDFLKLAQVALDCNCIIIKKQGDKITFGDNLDIVTETAYNYYFLPLEMNIEVSDYLKIDRLCFQGQVLEAGFSYINHDKKEITRSRVYVGTGYYNEFGQYVSRNEVLTFIYNKLVRTVKKIAPYTELVDMVISLRDETYLQEMEYRHKEYISPEFLKLREIQNYKLIL